MSVVDGAPLSEPEPPAFEAAEPGAAIPLGIQMRGYHDFGVVKQEGSAARVEIIPFAWHRGKVVVA
jgi:hypothetical protein